MKNLIEDNLISHALKLVLASCIHKIRFSIKKAEGSFDSVTLS